MSAVITGSVASTVNLNVISGQSYGTAACLSPDGRFVYIGAGNGFADSGTIYRFPVSNFVTAAALVLYPQPVLNGNVTWLHVSPDGQTLYAIVGTRLVTLAANGTSVAPIVLDSSYAGTDRLASANIGDTIYVQLPAGRGLYTFDPANGVLTGAFIPGPEFTYGTGVCRYKSNTILLGANLNSVGYLCEYDIATGHKKAVLGNGTNSIAAGAAFSSGIYQGDNISSDENGRIYFNDAGAAYMLDTTTGVLVLVPGTATRLLHSFSANCLIAGYGYDWNKLT